MNPKEQKDHRTATKDLADGLEALAGLFEIQSGVFKDRADAIEKAAKDCTDELRSDLENIEASLILKIGEERTYRLQRDEELRLHMNEQDVRLLLYARKFQERRFWSRINWLLTGR